MEHVYQSALVEKYAEQYGISRAFSCEGLEFYIVRYNAGEIIASPRENKKALQFILSNEFFFYRLKDDGGIYGVEFPRSEYPVIVLGDVEFVHPGTPKFFAEAKQNTVSLCLPISSNREKLLDNKDFLLYLLESLADKVSFASRDQKSSLEERLLYHMRHIEPDQTICFIEKTAAELCCSSRQLLRILKKLIAEGKVMKIKRGCYRLVDDLSF